MKRNSMLVLFTAVALGGVSNVIEAADPIVDVENLEVSNEKKVYPLAITFGEPGVLLDRLVFRSVAGQVVAEPAQETSSPAAVKAGLANVEPGPPDGRPRVIATSDGEIDDECSMVRFLLYEHQRSDQRGQSRKLTIDWRWFRAQRGFHAAKTEN